VPETLYTEGREQSPPPLERSNLPTTAKDLKEALEKKSKQLER
jgi:hypothetical protein